MSAAQAAWARASSTRRGQPSCNPKAPQSLRRDRCWVCLSPVSQGGDSMMAFAQIRVVAANQQVSARTLQSYAHDIFKRAGLVQRCPSDTEADVSGEVEQVMRTAHKVRDLIRTRGAQQVTTLVTWRSMRAAHVALLTQ